MAADFGLQNMKKVGNTVSNKIYNAQNKKPPVPIDADEADSAMERFIRSKYMQQGVSMMRSHNTGSTGSDETPPPLPPKTPGKFSFRSASSTFPLFNRSKKHEAPRSSHFDPQFPPDSPDSGRQPKVTQTFGANLGYDSEGDMQKKLSKLRELGFTNDRKNETILKGLNGNLERAIEALVRLEGRSPVTSPIDEFPSVTKRPSVSTGGQLGLSVARAETARPATASTNPFDISPVQPMSAQSTGNLANIGARNPFYNNNPFGVVTQSNDNLNQAFNNMSLAAPPSSQPLFPHHTGGLPNQQAQQVIYQQTMTPPMPSIPQNYASTAYSNNQPFSQQGQQSAFQPAQPLQPTQTGYNPFLNNNNNNNNNTQPQQHQGYQISQTSSFNTGLASTPTGGGYANNPFNRPPTRIASPSLGQIPEQSQSNFYSQPMQQQQQQQQPQMGNPFFPQQNTNPYMTQQPQQPQHQQQHQQQYNQYGQQFTQQPAQQVPQRANNASILALYNQPQLAPQPQQNPTYEQQQQQPHTEQQQGAASVDQVMQPSHAAAAAAEAPGALASMAMAGNKNPFLSGGAAPQPVAAPTGGMDGAVGNRSRDSMMALGMEWSNGRHSPDAFASLSARSR